MMKRITLLAGPALMALIAFAGEPNIDKLAIDDLVKNLGAQDYISREQATKALIARGAAAIPALEKAVNDKDVEVRMRAGRALRAIREKQASVKQVPKRQEREAAPEAVQPRRQPRTQPRSPAGNRATHRSTSMRFNNGEWEITITSGVGAEKSAKTYRGKSIEELKKKHPEVREALGGTTFQFGNRRAGAADPFKDFDKWFEQNGFGKRRRGDPFGGAADLQKEIERLNQWARWPAVRSIRVRVRANRPRPCCSESGRASRRRCSMHNSSFAVAVSSSRRSRSTHSPRGSACSATTSCSS